MSVGNGWSCVLELSDIDSNAFDVVIGFKKTITTMPETNPHDMNISLPAGKVNWFGET